MEILTIKRPSKIKTGLKVYGTILGDSGTTYRFGYFRRASFRGWLCSCPNFVLSMFGRTKHCKHIDFVQAQYGRYGAKVTPSKLVPTFEVGQKVFVSPEVNSYWTGEGIIKRIYGDSRTPSAIIEMITGRAAGVEGGFNLQSLKAL